MQQMDAVKGALLEVLVPVGQMLVRDACRLEKQRLVGRLYQREDRLSGHARWGEQRRAIYVLGRRVRIEVPRIRDRARNKEVSLKAYKQTQACRAMDEAVMRLMLMDLGTRRYPGCVQTVRETLGLAELDVSDGCLKRSASRLRAVMERPLGHEVCRRVILDAQVCASDGVILALGVTAEAGVVLLGAYGADKEDMAGICDFLQQLVARGLRCDDGVSFVVEGGHVLRTSVRQVFGETVRVQTRSAA